MDSADLPAAPPPRNLLGDIRGLIEATRGQVDRTVNSGMVALYWNIGRRIRQDVLDNKRAKYGKQIVYSLGKRLTQEYGPGFTKTNLLHMMRFAEVFPDQQIVYTLCRQLRWSHFRLIIYLPDPLKRDFYAEICRLEHWDVRTLHKKISDMLFERTALSRKPAALAAQELKELREQDKLTPDLVFRDPILLRGSGLEI